VITAIAVKVGARGRALMPPRFVLVFFSVSDVRYRAREEFFPGYFGRASEGFVGEGVQDCKKRCDMSSLNLTAVDHW
jgi:hypothetical protein